MSADGQFFTLAGVAVGALASYLVGALNERTRFRRDLARGWADRRFESFAAYATDVKAMSTTARRMAAGRGLHDRSPDRLSPQEGGPLLTEAEVRRSVSMELLRLLADVDTIAAAHRVNEAVWRLEWMARGTIPDVTVRQWDQAMNNYTDAFDEFHRCARRELGVPGNPLLRVAGPPPRPEALAAEPTPEPPGTAAADMP